MNVLFRFLVVVLVVAVLSRAGSAGEALIAEDSFVSATLKGRNYGASALLTVGPREKAFLRFDLSALPAGLTQAQIAKATLQLWVSSATFGGSVGVYEVTSEWSEKTVTGLKEPDVAMAPSGTLTIPVKGSKSYVTADLTTLVQSWVAGGEANNGIALVEAEGGRTLSFDSKENMATSHEPRLEIVLAGPQGQQGMAGANGMDGMKGDKGDKGDPGQAAVLPSGVAVAFSAEDNPSPPAGYADTQLRTAAWQTVTTTNNAPFQGRFITAGAHLLLIGANSTSLVEYDALNNRWGTPSNVPNGEYSAVAGGGDGFAYAFGGSNNSSGLSRFDPATQSWATLPNLLVTIAPGSSAIGSGTKIYVCTPTVTLEYDTSLGSYRQLAPDPTNIALSGQLSVAGGNVYAVGGGALAEFQPALNQWSYASTNFPRGVVVGLNQTDFYVLGGAPDFYDHFWRYYSSTGELVPEAAPPVTIQTAPALGLLNGQLYISSGGIQVIQVPVDSFKRIYIKN